MRILSCGGIVVASVLFRTVAAAGEPGLGESLMKGEPALNARLRYEYADGDRLQSGEALTLRARLGYGTKPLWGVHGFLEFETVSALNNGDDYSQLGLNEGGKGKAVIGDVETTELNKLYLHFSSPGERFRTRVGRQRILSGDSRFVPFDTYVTTRNFVWRQNEQTMDAVSLRCRPCGWSSFYYAYIDNIHRVPGQENGSEPPGEKMNTARFRADSHLLNAGIRPAAQFGVTAYGYLLDLGEGMYAASESSDTYGLNVSGKFAIGDGVAAGYALEYAQQFDNSATTTNVEYTADYYKIAADTDVGRLSFGLCHEVMGSDDGVPFRSPIATHHKVNGWADMFMTTPDDGLADSYGFIAYKLGHGFGGRVVLHYFTSASGRTEYGDEVDVVVKKAIAKNTSALVKYAAYNAHPGPDNPVPDDMERFWISLDVSF